MPPGYRLSPLVNVRPMRMRMVIFVCLICCYIPTQHLEWFLAQVCIHSYLLKEEGRRSKGKELEQDVASDQSSLSLIP